MQTVSIQMFLPSPDPTGIRVVSRDDWPMKAVVFPRSLVGEVQGRKEVQLPGVYLLAGGDTVHIGSRATLWASISRSTH